MERILPDPHTTTSVFPGRLLAGEGLPALRRRLERDYLVRHLRRLGGDTEALCRFLGLSLRQLCRRCARLGVSLRDEKAKGRET